MKPLLFILLFTGQIVGGDFTYIAQPGDSLASISARYGIDVRVLADANGLQTNSRIPAGRELRVDNRHIVPAPAAAAKLVINIPQRMLFLFDGNKASCSYPIAAGSRGWRTPLGEFEIVTKEENPTWDVPPSIQEELRRTGKPVVTKVPPSPDNPLGEYWIGLSLPGIGIHGTNAPSSIYKLSTHGCIRLHPEDIRNLFPAVEVGMQGRVIYEPVLITRVGDSIFVEAHPDPYKNEPDPLKKILDIARSEGFLDRLDLSLVQDVIRKRDGVARDVTKQAAPYRTNSASPMGRGTGIRSGIGKP